MPLKMISRAKSTGTSPLGMPSSCTRPPRRTAAKAWCRAAGTPDISHTTSAPSPAVSASTERTTSSRVASIVTWAPIWPASASRLAFTSEAITFAAPAARAVPTAKHPMGPPPPPPTATISPANSCPTTRGGRRRPSAQAFQSAMCRSVPHTPACRTAISTSVGPGDGLGTVVTLRPGARFSLTIACIGSRVREEGRGKRDGSENRTSESPVHLQRGAGNITGALRHEERDGRRQLLGAAHARHWNARDHLPHHLLGRPLLALGARFRQLRDALRRDEAGTDDVHGAALGGHLVRQRLREAQHAGAGRGRQ